MISDTDHPDIKGEEALKLLISAIPSAPEVFKQNTPSTFADGLIKNAEKLLTYVEKGIHY